MFFQLLDSSLGLDFVNSHMIELANFLGDFVTENSGHFTSLARILGATFALIAMATQLYKSIGRGEEIDILTLGRPFLFALVLGVWPQICQVLTAPGRACEDHFRGVFEKQKDIVYGMREKRNQYAWDLADSLRARRAAAEQAQMAAASGKDGDIGAWAVEMLEDGVDWLKDQVTRWTVVFETYMSNWLEIIIMWLGELLWQCAIYYVFIAKNIYIAVLSMFGPIYVSASILPMWKDSWSKWVSRMISVSFYGVMAYIVMTFTLQIMVYTITADINSMQQITGFFSAKNSYSGDLFGSTILTITAMFVGYKALVSLVPELASWVWPGDHSQGASHLISGMTQRTVGAGKSAGRAAMK